MIHIFQVLFCSCQLSQVAALDEDVGVALLDDGTLYPFYVGDCCYDGLDVFSGRRWDGTACLSPPLPDAATTGGFLEVWAGATHFVALKADGTVVSWGGDNAYGQTDVPDSIAAHSNPAPY